MSRKRAQNSVLALGRLISFGFRKKRHQADSRDAPLTSTPTTTISATGGRAFLLPSTVDLPLLSRWHSQTCDNFRKPATECDFDHRDLISLLWCTNRLPE